MHQVTTLAHGAAGFGRDASGAFAEGSGGDVMVVTFLDLNGEDSLDSMRARLAVFTRS